jgi:hypothetical protein
MECLSFRDWQSTTRRKLRFTLSKAVVPLRGLVMGCIVSMFDNGDVAATMSSANAL